jgi:proteic killer suppression protein
VKQTHVNKLRMILARLEVIQKPEDMNLPGFHFHSLPGKRKEQYSVNIQKNWRVVFKFDGIDVYDVDYLDYH